MDRLVDLFHRRWNAPVVAEIARTEGARLATLVHTLGPRGPVRQAIDFLIAHGLVRRNDGYGHPLRPEFLLTPRGERLAPGLCALVDRIAQARLEGVAYRKWSMPTLAAIGQGRDRFGAIRAALPGVTDRALALALKDLAGAGLVERRVAPGFPVGVRYAPTPEAAGLVRALLLLV